MEWMHGGNIRDMKARTGQNPVDFSANINPLGLPDSVVQAVQTAVLESERYPDPFCRELSSAIAAHEGVSQEHVLCGNGAADVIYRFSTALRPKQALLCAPTFSEYALSLAATGCGIKLHYLDEHEGFGLTNRFLHDLDGVEAIYLCNPNNPTGLTIPPDLLDAILARCADMGIYVLLDECFIDFLDDPASHTRIRLLDRYLNLVIVKAFTKLYAMPGLRLGYALCADPILLTRMAAAGPPWSVSNVAQAAGVAALSEHIYVEETRALVQQERVFLRQALSQYGITAMGEANFLLFKARPDLHTLMENEGIMIRNCANFAGLGTGWFRIAVRTHAENAQLLARMGRYLDG